MKRLRTDQMRGIHEPQFAVATHREAGLSTVTLVGEADLATEHRLILPLRSATCGSDAVVLDMSGLRFASARSVDTMAELLASAANRGVRVAVVGASRVITQVWLLSGFPMPQRFSTLDEARAVLRQPGGIGGAMDDRLTRRHRDGGSWR